MGWRMAASCGWTEAALKRLMPGAGAEMVVSSQSGAAMKRQPLKSEAENGSEGWDQQ